MRTWLAVPLLVALSALARAELPAEPLGASATLGEPGPHWALYFDVQSGRFPGGRYVLFDADSLDFLAHIPAGQIPSLDVSPDRRELYVTSSFADGPRALRRDVVAVYDTRSFAVQAEIPLPANRRALVGPLPKSALIGGGRWLVIFNFSAASSLDVVDVHERVHVGEIEVPGCSLVYPTGERGVSLICGDGTLHTVHLDERGALRARYQSEKFFDPDVDPIMENAVHARGRWHFASYGGQLYEVDLSGERPRFREPWKLAPRAERMRSWRKWPLTGFRRSEWLPGGFQLLTAHEVRGELYALMHPTLWSRGQADHVFPGAEVWVYDLATRERVRRIDLRGVAGSFWITPDAEPLLLVSGVDMDAQEMRLEIYDARTGKFLRDMPEFGEVLMGFQGLAPWPR